MGVDWLYCNLWNLINKQDKKVGKKTEKIVLFLLTIAGYKHGVPAGFEEANQQG